MEQTAEPTRIGGSTRAGSRARLLVYVLAVAVTVLGAALTVTLLVRELAGGGSDAATAPAPAPAETPASGFVFFDELHTTVLVSPGIAGENTIDLVVARHDGTTPTDVSAATVKVAQPAGGAVLGTFDAAPVEGSPGTFRATGVAVPSAGDWEFEISVESGAEPLSGTTLLHIGAPSSAR